LLTQLPLSSSNLSLLVSKLVEIHRPAPPPQPTPAAELPSDLKAKLELRLDDLHRNVHELACSPDLPAATLTNPASSPEHGELQQQLADVLARKAELVADFEGDMKVVLSADGPLDEAEQPRRWESVEQLRERCEAKISLCKEQERAITNAIDAQQAEEAEEFVRRIEAEARASRPAAGAMSDIEAMLASRGAAAGSGACGWTQNNKDAHEGCRTHHSVEEPEVVETHMSHSIRGYPQQVTTQRLSETVHASQEPQPESNANDYFASKARSVADMERQRRAASSQRFEQQQERTSELEERLHSLQGELGSGRQASSYSYR